MLSFVLLRQIEVRHIHFVCVSSDCFHFKSCQLKWKWAEKPKKLCGCLINGSVFSGVVEQGQKWEKQGTLHCVPWMIWMWIKWFDKSWRWLCLTSISVALRFLTPICWYFVSRFFNSFLLLFKFWNFSQIFVKIFLRLAVFFCLFFQVSATT